jgi:hypothetical protein
LKRIDDEYGRCTAVSSISTSSIAGVTMSGQPASCGGNAICGTLTLTTATGPATYSGTLTATPNTGTAAVKAVSMMVNSVGTGATLVFSACVNTNLTTSPTPASTTCRLSNAGQTAVSTISYSAINFMVF